MRQISLFKPYIPESAGPALLETLYSGFIGEGPKTAQFESELQGFLQHPYAALVNSGTTSLKLALKLAGVEPGSRKEILTTPLTCWATISAVLNAGGVPRWADIDPITLNLDIDSILSKITDRTHAILTVNWGGHPIDIRELKARLPRPIPIIQDNAHALGSTLHGKPLPFWSEYSCYSFQAIKHINTGSDGGLVCMPDPESYKRAKLLRWFGIDREDKTRLAMRCESNIAENGDKYHLNDFCSAIGLEQMKYLNETLTIAQRNAAFYDRHLAGIDGIISMPPPATEETKSAYWLYTLRVERRADFIAMMAGKGIGTSHVHVRCDQHTCVSEFRADLPVLEEVHGSYVAIPIGRWVSLDDCAYIVEAIQGGW